jgi:hypothetical protein
MVIASTLFAFRGSGKMLVIAGGRLAGGFGIALCTGLAAGKLFSGREFLARDTDAAQAPACSHTGTGRLMDAFRHAADDLFSIAGYLFLGACIAGCIRAVPLPDGGHLADLIIGSGIRQVPSMMALGFLLSLCSEADAFYARALSAGTGATLAFLVLGPMLDVKLLLMYFKVYSKRAVLFLAAAVTLLNGAVWVAFHLLAD